LLEFGGLELKESDGKLISMGWDGSIVFQGNKKGLML
jgi:hypothetical protein